MEEKKKESHRWKTTSSVTQITKPKSYDFDSLSTFLEKLINWKISQRNALSMRRLSQLCDLKSPNYFQQVISGKRNLPWPAFVKLLQLCDLPDAEVEYARGLWLLDLAQEQEEKELAESLMRRAVARKNVVQDLTNRLEVLKSARHLMIRELTRLKNFQESGEWISKQLRGSVSAEEAESSIQLLMSTGFLKRSAEGRLEVAEPHIALEPSCSNEIFFDFYKDNFRYWNDIILIFDRKETFMHVSYAALKNDDVSKLKELMNKMADEIAGFDGHVSSGDADRIFQTALFMLPIQSSK